MATDRDFQATPQNPQEPVMNEPQGPGATIFDMSVTLNDMEQLRKQLQ